MNFYMEIRGILIKHMFYAEQTITVENAMPKRQNTRMAVKTGKLANKRAMNE